MYWKRHLILPTLVLFLLGILFISSGGIAHAASLQPHPQDEGYQYTEVCCTSDLYIEMSENQALGPGTAEADGSFNVSSSWSASVGISVDLVDATVGFNAEQSVTRGGACYYTPPSGVWGTVEIDAVYYVVYFNIYWHDSVTGSNTYQGDGSAQQFSHFQCFQWNN